MFTSDHALKVNLENQPSLLKGLVNFTKLDQLDVGGNKIDKVFFSSSFLYYTVSV